MPEAAPRPDGIPGSGLPGPWPVGQYAAALRERLRGFARVQVFGEVFGLKAGRAKVWFELRDGAFDAVCCFAALHLFDEPLAALDAMARVLAPGGRVAILTSARTPLTPSPVGALIGAATGLRVFGRGEITAALEERGFVGVEQRVTGLAQFVGARLPG